GPPTIVRPTAGFGSGENENPLESRRPIPGGEITVYQTAPSAPFAIPCGRCAGAGSLNSRTFPTVATAIPDAASAASRTAAAVIIRRRASRTITAPLGSSCRNYGRAAPAVFSRQARG